MSSPFKVTLLQLKADLSGIGAATDKIELGSLLPSDIFALAEKMLALPIAGQPLPEPAIIVRRGEKGWRITPHNGMLRMHKSASAFDDYWTVANAQGLGELPPFRNSNSTPPIGTKGTTSSRAAVPRSTSRRSGFRTVLEVAGLVGAGIVLIAVGLWYGVPQRRLSDVPADLTLLSSNDERASLFKSIAGTYTSGRRPGDSVVTITEQGQISIAALDRNGQPITPPRLAEAARAARRKNTNCLLTSFGVISAAEPDAVTMGSFKLKRQSVN